MVSVCDSWDPPCQLMSFSDSLLASAGSPSVLLLMLQHHPHEGAQRSELCPVPVYTALFTVISGEKETCPMRFALIQAQGHG